MIQVISFDLGGVLFTEGKKVLTERLSAQQGYDPKTINAVLTSEQSLALRRGQIEEDEFWEYAKTALPPGYDVQLIRQEWQDSYLIDADVFDLLKELKVMGSHRLVAFSVNVKGRIPYLDQKYGFRRYFDAEVYSFDHGALKWEMPFFQALLRKAAVLPDQILHIDDHLDYTEHARDLGMNVAIYAQGGIAELREDLRAHGVDVRQYSAK